MNVVFTGERTGRPGGDLHPGELPAFERLRDIRPVPVHPGERLCGCSIEIACAGRTVAGDAVSPRSPTMTLRKEVGVLLLKTLFRRPSTDPRLGVRR